MYLNGGYQRYERSYKLNCHHKEYTILCPEFRKGGSLHIVIIPEFLIPRRPYPVYVYLYAIDLYSANPEKGQRWAAEATRQYFGLESFAHTTLGRALKALVFNLDAESTADVEKVENTDQKENTQVCAGQSYRQSEGTGFFSVKSTWFLRKRAAQFLGGNLTRAGLLQCIKIGQTLAREWFKVYGYFLM
jgi:hypothetical protein